MLNWVRMNHVWSVPRPVLSTDVALIQEGMALVGVVEGGVVKVGRSTGATSGALARVEGVAMSPRRTFGQNLVGVTVTAPVGGGTVLLQNTTTNLTDIGAFLATTGVAVAVSTSAASSSNIQSTTDSTTGLTALTFDASLAGNTYNVYYNYPMSALVETGLYGNPYPGFAPSDILQQVGIIRIGNVSTNCFDPAANWYSSSNPAPLVKVIAGGLFTDSANAAAGFIPTNVSITGLPTPANPWLDLEIH